MNLKIKAPGRETCEFCGNGFFPAPQVKDPRTCGLPDCLKALRRSIKARGLIKAFPNKLYHKVIDTLKEKKLHREWFLVYLLGETGMLLSEILKIRPADLSFKGQENKIMVGRSRSPKAWSPRVTHKISASTAGAIEWWIKKMDVKRWEKLLPFTKRMAQKVFKNALKACNVENSWGTRSLRHMYGVTVAMATDSESAVAKALRVKGTGSVKVYVKTARELMEKGA